jgi:uncharacterized membrane protein YedE/YeeE
VSPATARVHAAPIVLAALAGALFGAGLLVSGMTRPAKVIAFLDVSRGWDPSLLFVMAGAIGVYAVAFRRIRNGRMRPWFDVLFHLPDRRTLDRRLILGAALFGIGWGLAGICPGPGLVAAAGGSTAGLWFVVAMLAGMLIQHRIGRRRG